MKPFVMENLHCPWCQAEFNAGSLGPGSQVPEDTTPVMGDFALCTVCAELTVIDVGPLGFTRLRRADRLEYVLFAADFPTEWGSLRGMLGVAPHPESPLNA